jgi:O-antigen ligase
VGADAPSIVDAPGWVKLMPNAHNGYYDTMLELGYAGLAFLAIFLITTLHAIGRVAERDHKRAWLLLSMALFVIIYNFLETFWLRAFETPWVMFVIIAVEAARYSQPDLLKMPVRQPGPARPVTRGRLRNVWRPRLGARTQRAAGASTTSWQ